MSKLISNKEHSRTDLFFLHFKKTAAESYRLLLEAYGQYAPSQDTCERWFRRFESGDFDTRQEGRQGTWKTAKKFENVELQALLDGDDSETQKQVSK